jgi:hypothetical protein
MPIPFHASGPLFPRSRGFSVSRAPAPQPLREAMCHAVPASLARAHPPARASACRCLAVYWLSACPSLAVVGRALRACLRSRCSSRIDETDGDYRLLKNGPSTSSRTHASRGSYCTAHGDSVTRRRSGRARSTAGRQGGRVRGSRQTLTVHPPSQCHGPACWLLHSQNALPFYEYC